MPQGRSTNLHAYDANRNLNRPAMAAKRSASILMLRAFYIAKDEPVIGLIGSAASLGPNRYVQLVFALILAGLAAVAIGAR